MEKQFLICNCTRSSSKSQKPKNSASQPWRFMPFNGDFCTYIYLMRLVHLEISLRGELEVEPLGETRLTMQPFSIVDKAQPWTKIGKISQK